MNAQEKETIARTKVASQGTTELCAMFEMLTGRNLEQAMVRGWIMDELEKRDAEAFDRWIAVSYTHLVSWCLSIIRS